MELNRNNMRKLMGLAAFVVLLLVAVQNLAAIKNFLLAVVGILMPFLVGGCIAFILNVPMRGIESLLDKLVRKSKKPRPKLKKLCRPIALLLTVLIVIGIINAVIFIIAPELGRTLTTIVNSVPAAFERAQGTLEEWLARYPDIVNKISSIEINWDSTIKQAITFLQSSGGNLVSSTIGMASSIIGAVMTFIIGLIFSLYLLLQKEKLGKQLRRTCYAYLPEQFCDKAFSVLSLANQTFSRFLSGQCLEACILGLMFFVTMSIFRFPYALMVSVFIAFTALIPMFGAFIGCFVGALLILIVSPVKALWFVIMFLIVQQIEGNLVYPHVVGNSIGLPSIWVLVAVTVGGNMFGVVGMLLFIPMASVLYALLRRDIAKRLLKRKLPAEKFRPVSAEAVLASPPGCEEEEPEE